MAQLVLIRHGESVWNAQNLWTGWMDEPLTEKGRQEARQAADKLRSTHWDVVFQSDLSRAKETTGELVQSLGLNAPIITASALRERNYGIYTGRNKLDVKQELGDVEYDKLHRGWDRPIPGGESLKQVYERVVPYYKAEIWPKLAEGKNVIISAHGNSIRALYKYLKTMSDEEIEHFELPTGEIIIISSPTP